jgi:hypothetical protein
MGHDVVVTRSRGAEPDALEQPSGLGFAIGSTALLLGVVFGIIGVLFVPLLSSYVVTPAITGWRDPGPEIIGGCEKSLMCSEPGTFYATWVVSLVVYLVAAVIGFRAAVNRLAPRTPRRSD